MGLSADRQEGCEMPSELALNGGPRAVSERPPVWPRFDDEGIAAATWALNEARTKRDYISASFGGEGLEAFERDFAEYLGVKHVVSVNSGCAAIHVALMAAGVKAGDEVIVSPYTWGQTVSPILQTNAIPVFADIDAESLNLDPASVEKAISPHTKAILVVHLCGGPAQMDAIMAVAENHGLMVIEDCAQAIGARYKGKPVGAWGHLGAFSIGNGKNLAAGDGGMVSTDDKRLWELSLLYGHHPSRQGRQLEDPELREYIDSCCYTYRMHPITSVIARTQLKHLDAWNAVRRENADHLSQHLAEIPGVKPPVVHEGGDHVYHLYPMSYCAAEMGGVPRELYIEALQAEGVPVTAYVRTPIYLRRRYQEREYFWGGGLPWRLGKRDITYKKGDCPVAEARCAEEEMHIGSVGWYLDCTVLVDQYASAFRKLAENVGELKAQDRA